MLQELWYFLNFGHCNFAKAISQIVLLIMAKGRESHLKMKIWVLMFTKDCVIVVLANQTFGLKPVSH